MGKNFNIHDLKVSIREELLDSIPTCSIVNDRQLVMRCVFCGDSRKDKNKKRLGIKIDLNNDNEPIYYNCFNCGISGILTPKVLREIGSANNLDINSSLTRFNNKIAKNSSIYKLNSKKLNFKIKPYDENKINTIKKNYLEKRLGINITFKELEEYKVVLNLREFLVNNKVETITRDVNTCMNLDKFYLGFLTTFNEYIIMRNITTKNDLRRYEVYSIHKTIDNSHRFYTIPTDIDVLTTETIEINIAEGVIDILGIYNHIYNKNKHNKIFIAVCGSGYNSVINHVLNLGIVGGNVILNIYSDQDKDLKFFEKVIRIKQYKTWVKEINIFYNEKSKDYGVTKDEISLRKFRIV